MECSWIYNLATQLPNDCMDFIGSEDEGPKSRWSYDSRLIVHAKDFFPFILSIE